MTNGMELERWRSGQISFLTSTSLPGQISGHCARDDFHRSFTPRDTGNASRFCGAVLDQSNAFRVSEESRQGIACYVYKNGAQQAWINSASCLPAFFRFPSAQNHILL